MAGTIFVAENQNWHVGSHAFHPIVDRIRNGYKDRNLTLPNGLFEPIESGYEFISLKELSREDFARFAEISNEQLQTFGNDRNLSVKDRNFLLLPWKELQDLLKEARSDNGEH